MSRSTRRVTRQQFSAGTTADGNRLDRAAEDVVAAVNAVRRADMARGHVQTQIVAGWTPACDGSQDPLPFMPSWNNLAVSVLAVSSDSVITNPWRTKGCLVGMANPTQVDPVLNSPDEESLVWTTAIYLRRPCTLHGVYFQMAMDSVYQNKLLDPATTYKTGLVLGVAVDNPFLPESAPQDNIVFHKLGVRADALNFSQQALPVFGVDAYPEMDPPHPDGLGTAVVVDEQNLNIALPRDSRVRLFVCIPKYMAGDDPWTFGAVPPWANQVWSSVLTLLEPIEA